MNSPVEPDSFEDSSLKRVCRQAWAGEKCPLALLERLRSAGRQGSLQTGQTVQSMRIVPMWYTGGFGVAAAALVLITLGVVLRPLTRPADASAAALNLDPKITKSLIDMHDRCCQHNGPHQIAGARGDCAFATGHALEKRLGQPILASAVPEPGWKFHGGAVCPVANKPAAHLIFKNGSDSVSLFSMPRSVSPCNKTRQYEARYDDRHAIAGFIDSRGAYCLVGSGGRELTPRRLAAMRDRIQSTVVVSPVPLEYRPTVVRAELLQLAE
jgi:hypothetical protein